MQPVMPSHSKHCRCAPWCSYEVQWWLCLGESYILHIRRVLDAVNIGLSHEIDPVNFIIRPATCGVRRRDTAD